MMAFCTTNELLTHVQYGFRPKPSCTHVILSKTEFLRKVIEKKDTGQAFFINLQKVFDNLDNKI